MSKTQKDQINLIKRKIKTFGTKAAIDKACQETQELLVELETLRMLWDHDFPNHSDMVAKVVANIAEEFADVEISVYDTFKRIWPTDFAAIAEAKRQFVYREHLPKILNEGVK